MPTDPVSTPIRAVLFDVDGTLYHAAPMRRRMALALLTLPLRAPFRARRTLRHISAYRRALELVRHEPLGPGSIAAAHFDRAGQLAGEPPEALRPTIDEWLHQRPLPHLHSCRRAGLLELLQLLASRGVQIGFFSDYPVKAKLEALEVLPFASLCLAASDPEINAYKPEPAGLLHACERWGLSSAEVLYVGDRPEVDAAGAARASMRCAIVGTSATGAGSDFIRVSGFADLSEYLDNRTG